MRRVGKLRAFHESFDAFFAGTTGSMEEEADGDFVKYADAKVIIDKLVEALDAMFIGASGVGVPHKGERDLLQNCVNTAIRLKREAVGVKAAS